MNVALSVDEKATTGRPASSSAVFAMALSVATLIASEFMPAELSRSTDGDFPKVP